MKKTPFVVCIILVSLAFFSACDNVKLIPAGSSQPTQIAAAGDVVSTPPPDAASPTATMTPSGCAAQQGVITDGQVASALLRTTLKYRVYLPPCYSANPEFRYPVIYLLHAAGSNDKQWTSLGAANLADQFIDTGKFRPFLLVMPNEDNTSADPRDSQFPNALVSELIPAIDSTYATCPNRDCRIISGLGRGSAWALRIALNNPTMFAYAGLHSFEPFYGDMFKVESWLRALPTSQTPLFYLDIGKSDSSYALAVQMDTILTNMGLSHQWITNSGNAGTNYWKSHITQYFQWYVSFWHK